MLRGYLDEVEPDRITGWAQDSDHPERPVALFVTCGDEVLGRLLANRHRPDLETAGIGSGRHSFELLMPRPLSSLRMHVVRVRRETDGLDIANSPAFLWPSMSFDGLTGQSIEEMLGRLTSEADLEAGLAFLARQTEALLARAAGLRSGREAHRRHRQAARRGAVAVPADAPSRRALVVDDDVPLPGHDGGATVILSHVEALGRLGYQVDFVASNEMVVPDAVAASFERSGARLLRLPWYGSVEEVLSRHAGAYELALLHRMTSAHRYLPLVRHYLPQARALYLVADLHHLRLSRQAVTQERPELAALSRSVRAVETMSGLLADTVLTHSSYEASLLARDLGAGKTHLVRWSAPARAAAPAAAAANGVGLVGNGRHEPNADAARWLASAIVPLIRQRLPDLPCVLGGRQLPPELAALPGIECVGAVADLDSFHARIRVAVAPLQFGAGAKVKVVESFAAGRPCVCTPVAAEGLDLPPALAACVAPAEAAGFADAVCRLHEDPALCDRLGALGRDWVGSEFGASALDEALRQAIGLEGVW